MNDVTPTQGQPASARKFRLAPALLSLWLLGLTAATGLGHRTLNTLAQVQRSDTRSAQVDALGERLGQLETALASEQRKPAGITREQFDQARQALEQRLAQAEEKLALPSASTDLTALQARLAQVEERLNQRPPATAPSPRRKTTAPPKPQTPPPLPPPPFQILGRELRGGQPLLVIAPTDTASHIRLLGPGESEGTWRLEAIAGATATFRVGEQQRLIPLP